MAEEGGVEFSDEMIFDTLQLPAATMLYLTSGRIDWLNGKSVRCFFLVMPATYNLTDLDNARYLAANWDIAEIERDWKEKIQVENVLVNKLTIPK